MLSGCSSKNFADLTFIDLNFIPCFGVGAHFRISPQHVRYNVVTYICVKIKFGDLVCAANETALPTLWAYERRNLLRAAFITIRLLHSLGKTPSVNT